MPASTPPPANNNNLPMIAFLLGSASAVFALLTNLPGALSYLGFLSPVTTVFAVIVGVLALRQTHGEQRTLATRGIVTGIVGVVLFLFFLNAQATNAAKAAGPQLFTGSGIQLTYPGSWQPVDISQSSTCKDSGVTCVMALSPADGTSFNIIRTKLTQANPMDTVADIKLWMQYQSGAPNAKRTGDKLITVDGQSAARWLLDIPSQADASSRNYLVQVYVPKGTAFYTITALSTTQDTLNTYLPVIDGIIASIKFVP